VEHVQQEHTGRVLGDGLEGGARVAAARDLVTGHRIQDTADRLPVCLLGGASLPG